MKLKTTLLSLLAFTLFACNNDSSLIDKSINFRIRPINQFKKTNNLYSKNLEVKKEISYYNSIDKTIYLELPIANNKFKHFNTYNISSGTNSAILVLISDNTNITSLDKDITHLMDGYIPFENIENFNSSKIKFEEINELKVIIYNDNPDHFYENKNLILLDFQKKLNTHFSRKDPDEKGGGIIVEGP